MVNKMKFKFIFFSLLFFLISPPSSAADYGYNAIKQRQRITCGVDADYNYLANKVEGQWRGFDVDICRAFAQALLQDSESFRIVPVKRDKVGSSLNSGKIDVMLGHNIFSPVEEALQGITSLDIMYYDRLAFAARQNKANASSMKEYAYSKVCAQDNSAAYEAAMQYSTKYALGFNFIKFATPAAVKEAFYLRRCELVAGDEVFLKSIVKDLRSDEAAVLPEEMGVVAVKSYVAMANNGIGAAFSSVVSALKNASALGMNINNFEVFKSDSSTLVRNILGINPKMWKKLRISADWLEKYMQNYGSYTDILERNFGKNSALDIDITHNLPYNQGGLIVISPIL